MPSPSELLDLAAPFRWARVDDARPLAELMDMAGEGLPGVLWDRSRAPDQSALDYGASRAARTGVNFCYENAIVVEQDGKVAGKLLAYRLAAEELSAADLAGLPAAVRPLVELEALAADTFYINGVAVFPDARGKRLGTALLDVADDWARAVGCDRVSLIVDEHNPATRLYRRRGYVLEAARPIVPFPGFERAGDWHLMIRNLG